MNDPQIYLLSMNFLVDLFINLTQASGYYSTEQENKMRHTIIDDTIEKKIHSDGHFHRFSDENDMVASILGT